MSVLIAGAVAYILLDMVFSGLSTGDDKEQQDEEVEHEK